MRIKGGYYIKARQIQESTIMKCAPCVREIWDWLLKETTHSRMKRGKYTIERGQVFVKYSDIREGLAWHVGYKKMRYSVDSIKKAMVALRKHLMVATLKAQGGVIVTIINYDRYQNPKNYVGTNEGTIESTNESTTYINKNVKNVKNDIEPPKENTIVLRNYFCHLFRLKFDTPYLLDFAKDSAIFKMLGKVMEVVEVKRLMELFFESEDPFIVKAGHTVGVFKSQINKLQASKSKPTMRKL